MHNFIFLILVLSFVSLLFYFLYKENQRAKERHEKFIKTLDTISTELPVIRDRLHDFVCEYVKPKD